MVPVRPVGTIGAVRAVWPIRAVGSIGTIRTVRAIRLVPIGAVGPVRTVGLLGARTVRSVPVGSVRSVRLIRAVRSVGAIGPISIRASRVTGLLRTGTVRPHIGSVGSVRAVGPVLIFGARRLRTALVRRTRRPVRAFAVGAGGARRARHVRALRSRFGTRTVAPLLRRGRLFAAFCAMLRALARSVFGLNLSRLGQGRHRRESRKGEAGDGREHHQGTFHGLLPRTPNPAA